MTTTQKRWLDQHGTEMLLALDGATTIGGRIDALMRFYDLSFRDLAAAAGLSLTTTHALATGYTKNPSLRTIQAVAKALGTNASTLIGGE